MKESLRRFLELLKQTYREWQDDRAVRLAAALAYYTVFSLAPLLVIVIGVSSLVWDRQVVETHTLNQVESLLGPQAGELIGEMIATPNDEEAGVAATVIGTAALVLGALGVFSELSTSLNLIWEVKSRKPEGFLDSIRQFVRDRILSFGLILVIGFLLLVSLVVSTGLAAVQEFTSAFISAPDLLVQVLYFLVSTGVIAVLFAMVFKYLPDAQIAWRDVWMGAIFTAVLFSLGKELIGLYLGNSAVGSAFGAAGSLALILLWVYYSAQILFFGAEFTQVYANKYGSRIRSDWNPD
ncbi:MAG TPA: YihY/virulence factor BrkB family protein [Anaerolineales bacterium]|nr:YihY/virulence factor BrkB family protein [Anaerolineales bacterium]